MNAYLRKTFGAATHSLVVTSTTTWADVFALLDGKTGIYSNTVKNQDYTGHADIMYNGMALSGEAFPDLVGDIIRIDIWILP